MENTISRETTGTLSPIEFVPPFLLRLASLLIDYIVLLMLPLAGLISDKIFSGGLGIFTDRTLWLLAFIIATLNVVVLPVIFKQSIGKMVTGIRIVDRFGEPAKAGAILVRQTIGYLLTVATLGLGFLIAAVNRSGRTLHDLISGTVTVRARRGMS